MEKTRQTAAAPLLGELQQELHRMNRALRCAYDKFDYVTDPELVEASIYEINSLQARCDYLLRSIKAQLGAAEPETAQVYLAAAAAEGGPVCPS